jgi:hypothetical protein
MDVFKKLHIFATDIPSDKNYFHKTAGMKVPVHSG